MIRSIDLRSFNQLLRDIVLEEVSYNDDIAHRNTASTKVYHGKVTGTVAECIAIVLDCIMAFKGAVADTVQDRNALNIIRTGFGVERLDFYLRLAIHERTVLFESRRLAEAISCTDVACDSLQLAKITGSLCELDDFADRADKMILLQLIDSLFSEY